MLQVLGAEFTIAAGVLVSRCLTVDPLLFPAGFRATNILGTMHTMGAPIHLPAGVKLEVMAYSR